MMQRKVGAWLAAIGLVGVFGYWAYVSYLSGHEILSRPLTFVPGGTQTSAGAPFDLSSGPMQLEPAANPMRIVLGVTVSRARSEVDFRLALVDEAGTVAWTGQGSIHQAVSQDDRRYRADQTRYLRHASELFEIGQAGRYTLYAEIARVEEPQITLRGNAAEPKMLIYAQFAALGLIGLVLLAREEIRRRRRS
jgi:hypothetical protein